MDMVSLVFSKGQRSFTGGERVLLLLWFLQWWRCVALWPSLTEKGLFCVSSSRLMELYWHLVAWWRHFSLWLPRLKLVIGKNYHKHVILLKNEDQWFLCLNNQPTVTSIISPSSSELLLYKYVPVYTVHLTSDPDLSIISLLALCCRTLFAKENTLPICNSFSVFFFHKKMYDETGSQFHHYSNWDYITWYLKTSPKLVTKEKF